MKRNIIFRGQWLVTTLILAISLGAYGCADTASVSEDVAAPLSNLTVTPGTLQPGFLANTTNYAVNAPTSATSVTVTAAPKDNTAIVTIDGFVTTQRSVTLGGPGSTKTILIVVETQTGLETTYTVTVTRLLSSNNNLSVLSVTVNTVGQTLVPSFDANILDYTVNVTTNLPSITVSATKSDPTAVMSGSLTAGAGVATGETTIPLDGPGTSTPVSIVLTAPNGSVKTYSITVNHLSGDNNLSALTVTPGSLAPIFASNIVDYTVDVATDVNSVTVTATLQDTAATMEINGQGTSSGQARDFPLGAAPSNTDINILVRAPNGSPNTYTITVNRPAPSSNTNLLALLVTADLMDHLITLSSPQPYIVNVAANVSTVTVTATPEDTNASMTLTTITLNEQGILPGVPSPLIFLGDPGSDTTITIKVRAQNTVDTRTYTIWVHRADPGPPPPP